ncbi:MAG: PAS domain-containing sensor histidine kinase [Syntrophobacteraceae bacterium]
MIEVVVEQGLAEWWLDGDQIKEAALNLCVNALQSLQGEGHLWLEARASGERLEITVRDDGAGIPREIIPNIFRPFYSLRTAGTGLGLAICKEIVDAHGGRISVSSIPRHMTVFRITLPPHHT